MDLFKTYQLPKSLIDVITRVQRVYAEKLSRMTGVFLENAKSQFGHWCCILSICFGYLRIVRAQSRISTILNYSQG